MENSTRVDEFLTFFRSLDSSERDSLFEKIKEEYAEIKYMEATGFMTAEQKYGIIRQNKFNEKSADDSLFSKMKQKIESITDKKKIFSKNPKPTQETRDRLQTKMREAASKNRESQHTKDKGVER